MDERIPKIDLYLGYAKSVYATEMKAAKDCAKNVEKAVGMQMEKVCVGASWLILPSGICVHTGRCILCVCAYVCSCSSF